MSSNGGIERKRVAIGAGATIKNSVGCIEVVGNILGVVEFFVSYRRPYSFCCPIDDLLNENASFCEKLLLSWRAKPRPVTDPPGAVPSSRSIA